MPIPRHQTPALVRLLILAVLACIPVRAADIPLAEPSIVFADETAVITLADWGDATAVIRAARLDRDGWNDLGESQAQPTAGRLQVQTDQPGLYRFQVRPLDGDPLASQEFRLLGLGEPPPLADPAAVRQSLPRQGDRLLQGEPFTIVAMGDSVTATGDYPLILQRWLERATGNDRITVQKFGHAGKSIDATIRNWDAEVATAEPHLGLLMYGLNEQAAGVGLLPFADQVRYVHRRLADDHAADLVLLEPTPHIQPPEGIPEADWTPQDLAYMVRTSGYVGLVRDLAAELGLPVAHTFDAIWGPGRPTMAATIPTIRPLYPPHFRRQWETLLDLPPGKTGDTIHPNILGHAAIAHATYRAIAGLPPSATRGAIRMPSIESARTEWRRRQGITTTLSVTNPRMDGLDMQVRLHVLPRRETAAMQLREPAEIAVAPASTELLHVDWQSPDTTANPALVDTYPYSDGARPGQIYLTVVMESLHGCQVIPVPAPWHYAAIAERSRSVSTELPTAITVWNLLPSGRPWDMSRPLPPTSPNAETQPPEAGRVAVEQPLHRAGGLAPIFGVMAWTRLAGAVAGEAEADGDLAEFAGQPWAPVGLPVQARWSNGHEDNRTADDPAMSHWAFRAGADALHVATRITGWGDKDSVTLWFDPREPDQLGTPGPYFWVSLKLLGDGRVQVRPGETSPKDLRAAGRWTEAETGERQIEFSIPYPIFGQTAWPTTEGHSPDMGLSIHWRHVGPDGAVTNLQWSENGHPWNPRWYGVIRRIDSADEPLPYRIIIE